MPLFRNFLPRPESEAQRRFAGWERPSAPPLKWGSDLPAFPRPEPRHTPQFAPALVIGLGDTGEAVLRDWLSQLAQSSSGPHSALRAYLLTERPTAPLPEGGAQTRQADLTATVSSTRNRRAATGEQFRQVSAHGPFREWLEACARDLHRDIRLIIVGSVHEPIIGILGDMLQIIRLVPGRGNPYLTVTAFVAMDTPDPAIALDDAETYAALREIGRFTFGGEHWMEPLPGQQQQIIRSALLDQLFLIEGQSASTAIAEALFTLLHPSTRSIWENLANNLARPGHEAAAHTFGVAALSVPRREIQAYVAARLARAALCGEHPQKPNEGLRSLPSSFHSRDPETLASRWLRNGPAAHPLFDWLLDAVGPAHFRSLPPAHIGFDDAFQSNIANGLLSLLNDHAATDHLAQGRAALAWLIDWLKQIREWVAASPDANQRAFAEMIARWRDSASHLARQLDEWEHTLTPHTKTAEPVSSWRQPAGDSSDWRSSAATTPSTSAATLSEWLDQRQRESESALKAVAGGSVRRALTANDSDGLVEIEKYYKDTIRPELSRFGATDASSAFRRVRERLGWWVELMPGRPPTICLTCIPPTVPLAADGQPPPGSRFTANDVERVGQALLEMTKAQANAIEADLTGLWFQQRLAQLSSFLSRSNTPLLAYDENAAIHYPGAASRRAYLIAQDKTITAAHRAAAFPSLPSNQINELDGGDPARATAITFWLNIPLSVIEPVRAAYAHYGHRSSLHLFPQERTAAEYERRWRELTGESISPFPPDLTLALADPHLVTLFCQALICGLVEKKAGAYSDPPCWTMSAVEDFDPLPLAADLWPALKKFALELPNESETHTNPAKHFYRERRGLYVETLRAAIRAQQRQPENRARRENFSKTTLEELRRRSQQDPLTRAYVCVLEVEFDEPLWAGW